MKAYKEKKPVMVIGGRAGSFLGEYQAGGYIVVLGIDIGEKPIVGNFPCTGMHGGKMFLRVKYGESGIDFPGQVTGERSNRRGQSRNTPLREKVLRAFRRGRRQNNGVGLHGRLSRQQESL